METQEKHLQNSAAVLERLKAAGVRLQTPKCSLVPRPLPDFILQPWRKIGRRPGTNIRHGPEMVCILAKTQLAMSFNFTLKNFGTDCLQLHLTLPLKLWTILMSSEVFQVSGPQVFLGHPGLLSSGPWPVFVVCSTYTMYNSCTSILLMMTRNNPQRNNHFCMTKLVTHQKCTGFWKVSHRLSVN